MARGIALAVTVVTLVGILSLTSDLAITDATFADGVGQARQVDSTTDKALKAGLELPTANDALSTSYPQVVGTIDSLQKGRATLRTLGGQLSTLGDVLGSADSPLGSIIDRTKGTTAAAVAAEKPVNHIVGTLDQANSGVAALGPKLDATLGYARSIESKLRVLVLVPQTK
jgi:hypothetical protein